MSEKQEKPRVEIKHSHNNDTWMWVIVVWVFLFYGDPDLHDAIIDFIRRH